MLPFFFDDDDDNEDDDDLTIFPSSSLQPRLLLRVAKAGNLDDETLDWTAEAPAFALVDDDDDDRMVIAAFPFFCVSSCGYDLFGEYVMCCIIS